MFTDGQTDGRRAIALASVLTFITYVLSAKLHYTDTGYDHRLRTPPTDKLTTIRQLNVVQQIHHSGIAMWQTCCRIVVSSSLMVSVGGVVQHVRSRVSV